jgi:hypothetical protein
VRFREFVDQKVLRHHANHFGKRPTVHHPPNSDCGCLTDSGESEADEDAEEDGKDTQSNCCSSEPGGAQSFDGTPWSGSRSRNMNEYAAPTAPMVSKPSSMGQTKSRLDSDNFVPNRATPQEYQRQYRTSMDDRMARGSSRSKPEPTSDSVPDILFDVNPNSPSQNPPEIPSWAQDESIRVGARGGLKRAGVCSAAPEEGEVRKKRKYVRKVPCPKLSLVVKLKLTREKSKKILQGAHHQGPGVETSAPAPLASSEWPVGRLESYNAIPSTQECHASPFTLQSHEQENMAIPSSRVSHSHPRESDKAAETLAAVVDTSVVDTSAINVPATNSSVPNIHSAVAEDRDVRGRDGFVAALPDLENEASRQQTAAKTPDIPTAVEQAHVEQFPAQVMENSPPVATSTHDLNDETSHSTVPEANITPAKVDPPSASTHLTRKIAFTSAEAVESMGGVAVIVKMKRQGQAKMEDMNTIEHLDIISRGNFFGSMRFELGDNIGEDDTILQAKVKRVSEAPIEGLRTEFTIVQASKKNTSWETLLKGLVEMYKRDRVCVELKLEACLLVGKKTDEKLMK